jgi:hypothetical protein
MEFIKIMNVPLKLKVYKLKIQISKLMNILKLTRSEIKDGKNLRASLSLITESRSFAVVSSGCLYVAD